MNKKIDTPAVRRLAQSLCAMKNEEECMKLLEDVCTTNEILAISQRHEVAYLLNGGHTYLEIAEQTGASTATISRVNRSLGDGGEGYRIAFQRNSGENN